MSGVNPWRILFASFFDVADARFLIVAHNDSYAKIVGEVSH